MPIKKKKEMKTVPQNCRNVLSAFYSSEFCRYDNFETQKTLQLIYFILSAYCIPISFKSYFQNK